MRLKNQDQDQWSYSPLSYFDHNACGQVVTFIFKRSQGAVVVCLVNTVCISHKRSHGHLLSTDTLQQYFGERRTCPWTILGSSSFADSAMPSIGRRRRWRTSMLPTKVTLTHSGGDTRRDPEGGKKAMTKAGGQGHTCVGDTIYRAIPPLARHCP